MTCVNKTYSKHLSENNSSCCLPHKSSRWSWRSMTSSLQPSIKFQVTWLPSFFFILPNLCWKNIFVVCFLLIKCFLFIIIFIRVTFVEGPHFCVMLVPETIEQQIIICIFICKGERGLVFCVPIGPWFGFFGPGLVGLKKPVSR